MAGPSDDSDGADPYRHSVTSPDGRIRIDYAHHEGRMSHWIETPVVFDRKSGKTVFALTEGVWDAGEEWTGAGRFTLFIRKYPSNYTLPVHFDVQAGSVRLDSNPDEHPLSSARRLVEDHFAGIARNAPSAAEPYRRPVPPGIRWVQGIALVIAVALLLYVVLAM